MVINSETHPEGVAFIWSGKVKC